MALSELWSELRRRKVAPLALTYVIVAWVLIQAAATIFPALLLPGWAVTFVVVLLLLGFPVALLLAWTFDVTPGGVRRTPPAGAGEHAAATSPGGSGGGVATLPPPAPAGADGAPAAERSIAVLPFVNMSDDRENEYFSDGMTEEILNALAKVEQLRVASRTSSFTFKGKDLDVLEIARRLRVESVVEGSVRKAGSRIRVTAQLISAADGYHLWSHTYDRELEDVFRVQDEIARAIVEALKVELVGEEERPLVAPVTHDVRAYTLYLKGRFLFTRFKEADLRRSLELYREALALDPEYARAYAGIADTWMQLADDWVAPEEAYPAAKEAAEKAVALDDALAEAHTAIGKVLGWFEWRFDAAELAMRRAVAANPRYADAHWGLGSILPPNGQLEEGVREMRTTLSLDPLSPIASYWLARYLYFQRKVDAAVEELARAVELDPTSFRPLLILGQCQLLRGQSAEALASFHRAHEVSGHVPSAVPFIARAMVATGDVEGARARLRELEAGSHYVRAEYLAAGYAATGEPDRAFAALERALAQRSSGLIYLHVDPSYDPLRADPRYAGLVSRIGLRSET